jgi:tRNA A58 N-methylase Trm61
MSNTELGLQQLNILADTLDKATAMQLRKAIDLIMLDLPQPKTTIAPIQKKE